MFKIIKLKDIKFNNNIKINQIIYNNNKLKLKVK